MEQQQKKTSQIYLSISQAAQHGAGQIPDDSSPHPPLCGRPHRNPLPGEFDLLLFVFSSLKSDRRKKISLLLHLHFPQLNQTDELHEINGAMKNTFFY